MEIQNPAYGAGSTERFEVGRPWPWIGFEVMAGRFSQPYGGRCASVACRIALIAADEIVLQAELSTLWYGYTAPVFSTVQLSILSICNVLMETN